MKILDTSALDYMVKTKISTRDLFYITPDIHDEYEAWYEQKLPPNIQDVFRTDWFDKAEYLNSYRQMLNKYGASSFYNMSGFGDISILALLKTQQIACASMIPGLIEESLIITKDEPLSNKIRREFPSSDTFGAVVKLAKPEDIF
jgi:hypothetical protein